MNEIQEVPIHLFAEKAIKEYIEETVCSRAISDMKDGLKPVQRKILWAMYGMGLHHNLAHKKSARVVGNVIGKFNPHGDASCYQAMVNMAQAFKKYNLIDGQGNWGSFAGDGAAAPRYTECRLSKIADIALLDKGYLNIVPYEDNYDGTEIEPVYLPARLPFILLNGIQGIATATRTGLPSFTIESLTSVCIKYLKTGKLELEDLNLDFTTVYGGRCISTKDEIQEYFKSGSGSILYEPTYLIFKDRIEITGVQDNFDLQKMVEKLEELQEVKSVRDEGTGQIKIVIYLNCKHNDQKAMDKIKKTLQTRMLYTTTILNRLVKDGQIHSNYRETTIIKVIENWCKFRVALEKKYIQYLIKEKDKEINYQKLLLKAGNNLKLIFDLLSKESKDLESQLSEKLEISNEQAKVILDLPIKRLSRLDTKKSEEILEKLQKEYKELNVKLDNPVKYVIKDLEQLRNEFGKDEQDDFPESN